MRLRWPERLRVWAWLVAAATNALACRHEQPRTPTWSSSGAALGQRVRNGELPGVTHQQFLSPTLQLQVGAVVVTPPGYAQERAQPYPVVYIFPGIGGDEWTYLRDVGLDNAALQALFADPVKAPIVVFGHPGDSGGHGRALTVLSEELVAFVDQHYRTRRDAAGRSLEGFSLGGATVLTLLLHRPDVFGQAIAASAACYLLPTCAALRANLVAQAKRHNTARVWFVVGEKEYEQNRAISDELAPLLSVQVETIPGVDHDWGKQIAAGGVAERIAAFHLTGFEPAREVVSPPR
ncbi:MAG: hypothetical protein RL701_483 [Pseudomonadota bacterium]|jgi:enterochelin esterase-like enzyme